jgi:hypothetical protein
LEINKEEDKKKKNVNLIINVAYEVEVINYDVCLGSTMCLQVYFTSTKTQSITPKPLHALSTNHKENLFK